MFRRILIVCVGNVCRSPMAMGELRHRLISRSVDSIIESAGLDALVGRPPDPIAQEIMRERGVDISAHRARQLTPEMIRQFEVILTMEAAHQREVEGMALDARGRVRRLGHWKGFDVPDPHGGDRAAFARSLDLILRGIDDFEKAFWGHRARCP